MMNYVHYMFMYINQFSCCMLHITNSYVFNLFYGVLIPIYAYREDGTDVPELVAGVLLSYVYLYGFYK